MRVSLSEFELSLLFDFPLDVSGMRLSFQFVCHPCISKAFYDSIRRSQGTSLNLIIGMSAFLSDILTDSSVNK